MMSHVFSKTSILFGIALWWCLFSFFFFSGVSLLGLSYGVCFFFLLLIPGFLTVAPLRLARFDLWPLIGIIVGVSILELMIVALLGNTLLPLVGLVRPLDPTVLFVEVSSLVGILSVLYFIFGPTLQVSLRMGFFVKNIREAFLAYVPMLFPVLATVGAMRLNNGGGNGVTVFMLGVICAYVAVLVFSLAYKKHVHTTVISSALYFISFALLLMTSLRGWQVAGHDIQTEFYVFELAKTAGLWAVDVYHSAYNACISITVFPVVLAHLLNIPDMVVYKVLFQGIFALVPPIVYAVFRRYVSEPIAFLSAFYFIAFPTFFGDMPMLNRQEIAFLFLALMVYTIFHEQISLAARRVLFVVFGCGMILSHYSTTYTVIALLIFLVIMRPLLDRSVVWARRFSLFRRSAIDMGSDGGAENGKESKQHLVAVWMVIVLAFSSFLWSSVLTDTSSNSIVRVITKTLEVMRDTTKEDGRSGDVLYGLFSWKKSDPETSLNDYRETVVAEIRQKASPSTYYDVEIYEQEGIHTVSDTAEGLPTFFGKHVLSAETDISSIDYTARQISAKILQVLIVIGFLFALFRNTFNEHPYHREFVLLAVGSIVMLLSQILLPVLSAEYGVLRAFQQSLMFFGVFIVTGSMAFFVKMKKEHAMMFAATFALIFFIAVSGLFVRFFFVNPPRMHLSDTGMYYDLYYPHESDSAAADWIDTHVPKDVGMRIQTDRPDVASLKMISGITIPGGGIYPSIVEKDAYVLLNYQNTHTGSSFIIQNGDIIRYRYPIRFLDENKDLLYDNGITRIYK
ncbi:MAG: DUF2206 domain-containing protein [Candidatus Yonathbacteria bacterium]|nr:DUF2206 domain-containing protein [Candidatus Yonathbacteria bacterium]